MDILLRDIRYAFRQLKRSPTFTLVAALTLALGIGANTAIFSVVNAVMLRPLGFSEPEQILRIYSTSTETGDKNPQISYPTLSDIQEQSRSFSQFAGFRYWISTISGKDVPESYLAVYTTERLFPLLGVTPRAGRTFQAVADKPNGAFEVILSDAVWRSRFGSDPGLLGKNITVDGRSLTVVGILPPSFRFPDMVGDNVTLPSREPDIYLPAGLGADMQGSRGNSNLWVVGRLAPGVTAAAAIADLQGIWAGLLERYPDHYRGRAVAAARLKDEIVGGSGRPLLVLLGAVGLVLLIACANVAGLLLARAAARQREFTLRSALGAAPSRLVRQVLTESVLLAMIGGTAGWLIGAWGVELIRVLAPNTIPRIGEISVDTRILLFTTLLSVLCGLLFGASPAFLGSHRPAAEVLRDGERGSGRKSWFRSGLVISEVALSVVLLCGAGLLLRSFFSVLKVEPGFDGTNVITMMAMLPGSRYPDPASQIKFAIAAQARIREIPGIEAAGSVNTVPLSNLGGSSSAWTEFQSDQQAVEIPVRPILGEYLDAMHIKVSAGRQFTPQDSAGAPAVAILSQAAAKKLFGVVEALGRKVTLGNDNVARTVVGIVGDVRDVALEQPPTPMVYYPFQQGAEPLFEVVARSSADPHSLIPEIRRQLASIDPEQAVFLVRTMEELQASTLQQRRFHLILLGSFAAAALLMAAIGLYGLLSFSVAQRTREIGIRVALGAAPRQVRRLLLLEGCGLAAIGVVIGLIAALATSRLLRSQLVGVGPLDPAAIGGAVVVLMLVAAIATLVPARRATRVDPLEALRQG